MIRIRLSEESDAQRWDSYVLARDDAGPYHLFAWRRAVEGAYGHKAVYLMAEDDDQHIRGILPLVLVQPPLFKGVLVSLPYCDYGGALASDAETLASLHHTAGDHALKMHARLEIRLKNPEESLGKACRMEVQSHKTRMVRSLPATQEELWDSFKSKLRSQVRRPMKDGFQFVIGSGELLNDFYRVFAINMRDLGSPVHSREWIGAVVRWYGERARVGVVYTGTTPAAAGIILETNGLVAIPWASALDEYGRSSPNMLLYWGFLAYACEMGCTRFDFGRSTPGEGTYRFKEQWGAEPYPLFWYREAGPGSTAVNDSSGRIRRLVEGLWARLPRGMTDTIGPMVRKYITL